MLNFIYFIAPFGQLIVNVKEFAYFKANFGVSVESKINNGLSMMRN